MASTVWKGQLTFGLVSVPIKLFRAARAEKVHMHFLRRQTGARVKRVFVPSDEVETPPPPPRPAPPVRAEIAEPIRELPRPASPPPGPVISVPDLVRGFEYEKDKYVEFEPRELQDLAPQTSGEMQILEFVQLAEVDPVYFENSYYVAPDKQGDKPYALLFEALRKTGRSAVAEFVMHRRDHIALLRAGRHGVIAHTLFHEDEVRQETEFHADTGAVVPREMELAVKLIDALAAPFEPQKFKDKYRDRLNAAISEKISGDVRESNVIDIVAALQASLAQARKPAASEKAASGKKKRSG